MLDLSNHFLCLSTDRNRNDDKWFRLQSENQEPRESGDTVVTVENMQTAPQPDVHLVALFQHQYCPVRSVHILMVSVVIVGSHYLLAVFAQVHTHAVLIAHESREAEVVRTFHRSRELSCRKKSSQSEGFYECEPSARSLYPSKFLFIYHHDLSLSLFFIFYSPLKITLDRKKCK